MNGSIGIPPLVCLRSCVRITSGKPGDRCLAKQRSLFTRDSRRKGLTQDKLAERVADARWTGATISRYETGEREMGITSFIAVADALNASLDELADRKQYHSFCCKSFEKRMLPPLPCVNGCRGGGFALTASVSDLYLAMLGFALYNQFVLV